MNIAEEAAKKINAALGCPTDDITNFITPHVQAAIDEATTSLKGRLKVAVDALEAECKQFRFPDEDRPICHQALQVIKGELLSEDSE